MISTGHLRGGGLGMALAKRLLVAASRGKHRKESSDVICPRCPSLEPR